MCSHSLFQKLVLSVIVLGGALAVSSTFEMRESIWQSGVFTGASTQ
jgi:hypothetical protein